MKPLLAVTSTGARSHYWTGESQFHNWQSLCGLWQFRSDLFSPVSGYKVCARCAKRIKTLK